MPRETIIHSTRNLDSLIGALKTQETTRLETNFGYALISHNATLHANYVDIKLLVGAPDLAIKYETLIAEQEFVGHSQGLIRADELVNSIVWYKSVLSAEFLASRIRKAYPGLSVSGPTSRMPTRNMLDFWSNVESQSLRPFSNIY
jgi:hypothetical protein